MSNLSFNLRNISPEVMTKLKREASKQNTSVNSLILKSIERDLNITHQIKRPVYDDLDYLAGTWSEKDKTSFEKRIKSLEEIDKELWT